MRQSYENKFNEREAWDVQANAIINKAAANDELGSADELRARVGKPR